ncbi:MAG: hypothetical protein QOH86_2108 [Sphingomonadales bacterium]|jgi:hypothetical protein|nr:hypothetical protein [Sphingomonadales bacterium]
MTIPLEPGRNCWPIARANRAALIVDGCDYFRLVRQAMLKARTQILLVGWKLDKRIALDEPGGKGDPPVQLGPYLSWLVKNRPEAPAASRERGVMGEGTAPPASRSRDVRFHPRRRRATMSSIPNSAMPHAQVQDEPQEEGGLRTTLSKGAGKIADLARDNPKTAIAAGVAVAAGAIAAAAIPALRGGSGGGGKTASKGSSRKKSTAKA